jgi:hypothetical protein
MSTNFDGLTPHVNIICCFCTFFVFVLENAMVALSTAVSIPCRYTAFVGVDKTLKAAMTSQEGEMELCGSDSFNLSSYAFTSPKSKPGFGKKFVNFFSSKQDCVCCCILLGFALIEDHIIVLLV